MIIDLHGCHIHDGWKKFKREIDSAYFDNYKKVTVITGRGAMMNEIHTWAQNHPRIREIRQSQPHNRGSFTVFLVKRVDKR